MSIGDYLVGVALLAAGPGTIAWGAVRLRRRLLPGWRAAPARLFEAIVALSATITVSQILGAVGGFRRAPLFASLTAAGLVLALAGRPRSPADDHDVGDSAERTPRSRAAVALAIVSIAMVAGAWSTRTASAVVNGTTEFDSLWYHLPHAARFSQEGWLTRLHFTGPDFPETFHPSNAELLHGLGMVAFGSDALSPLLNVGWVALALLAAWSIGRPFGAAPMTTTAATLIIASPLASFQNAGSGSNDVAVIFFTLAAGALLVQPPRHRGQTIAAALSAGLAVSTKLTALAPVAVLTVAVLVLWRRDGWRRLSLDWLTPLAATGAFWYVRNLVRTGSPIPGQSFGPLPFSSPPFETVDRFGYSVADYLGDGTVWREFFLPGLHLDFGRFWWLTLGLAAAGSLWAVFGKHEPLVRVLGIVGVLGSIAYLATPTTALGTKGRPLLFASNVTYLTPALMMALVAIWLIPASRRAAIAWPVLVVMFVALITSQLTSDLGAWDRAFRTYGIAIAATIVVLGGGAAALRERWTRVRPFLGRVLVLGAAAVIVAAFPLLRLHVRDAYRSDALSNWARSLDGERIAIAGFQAQYPLYGEALQNYVQYVGSEGEHGEFTSVRDCRTWRSALRSGRYTFVVLKSALLLVDITRREIPWTRSDPAARPLFRAGGADVFAFDSTVPDPGCPA